jgi:hypothetical protein
MGDASTQKNRASWHQFLIVVFDPGTLPSRPKKASTTGVI